MRSVGGKVFRRFALGAASGNPVRASSARATPCRGEQTPYATQVTISVLRRCSRTEWRAVEARTSLATLSRRIGQDAFVAAVQRLETFLIGITDRHRFGAINAGHCLRTVRWLQSPRFLSETRPTPRSRCSAPSLIDSSDRDFRVNARLPRISIWTTSGFSHAEFLVSQALSQNVI